MAGAVIGVCLAIGLQASANEPEPMYPLRLAPLRTDRVVRALAGRDHPGALAESARRLLIEAAKAGDPARRARLEADATFAQRRCVAALRRAANVGDADVPYWAGVLSVSGKSESAWAREAAPWFRRAAEAGSASACLALGMAAEWEALAAAKDGVGPATPADLTPERRWQAAAEAGDVDARVEYALILLHSQAGAVPDRSNTVVFTAWRMLQSGAEAGRVRAMHALWTAYARGFCDIPRDIGAAYREANRASELGYGPAHRWLQRRFETGDLWPANAAEAARYGALAEACGAVPVSADGAVSSGEPELSPEADLAAAPSGVRDPWFDRAADRCVEAIRAGRPVRHEDAGLLAMFRNRRWYELMGRLRPEVAAAVACGDWRRAEVLVEAHLASAVNPETTAVHAHRLMRGSGVRRDTVKAAALATRAAESGCASGALVLAELARRGWGVPKDAAESVKWTLLARQHFGDATSAPADTEAVIPAEVRAEGARRAAQWMAAHQVD